MSASSPASPPVGARSALLVVDDEPQIHRFLRPTLEAAGYTVARADNGADALRAASAQPPALILLDLGLPDIDGQTVLKRLRAASAIPVIVLSARDRAEEKIEALDSGANDYVEKPFDIGELLARIRNALRHAANALPVATLYQDAGLEVDLDRRLVHVGGNEVALTPREYDLLALLVRNAGRVMTHRQLLTAVWGPAHANDVQYLRVYIGQLRNKLGYEISNSFRTEAGIGYRLVQSASQTADR